MQTLLAEVVDLRDAGCIPPRGASARQKEVGRTRHARHPAKIRYERHSSRSCGASALRGSYSRARTDGRTHVAASMEVGYGPSSGRRLEIEFEGGCGGGQTTVASRTDGKHSSGRTRSIEPRYEKTQMRGTHRNTNIHARQLRAQTDRRGAAPRVGAAPRGEAAPAAGAGRRETEGGDVRI